MRPSALAETLEQCPACGYDRRGLGRRRCPECGAWPTPPVRGDLHMALWGWGAHAALFSGVAAVSIAIHWDAGLPPGPSPVDLCLWSTAGATTAGALLLWLFRRRVERWPAWPRRLIALAAWLTFPLFGAALVLLT